MESIENERLSATEKINTYLIPFFVAFSGAYWTYSSRLEKKFFDEIQHYTEYGYKRKVRDLRTTQQNAKVVFWIFQIIILGLIVFGLTSL